MLYEAIFISQINGRCGCPENGLRKISGENGGGRGAFNSCVNLSGSLTIPEGVVSLGAMAFSWCDKLAAIVLPDSMTEIGMNAFAGCNALTEITIPTGLKELPGNLFSFCTNLKKVIIPDSIQKISNWTFAGCNNVVLYGTKDSYAETFANANGLEFQEI